MNLPRRIIHFEAVDRPLDARWLDNDTIIVCRQDGLVEIRRQPEDQQIFRLTSRSQPQRFERLPISKSLFLFSQEEILRISYDLSGVVFTPLKLPFHRNELVFLSETKQNKLLATKRSGEIFIELAERDWRSVASAKISDISGGAPIGDNKFIIFNTHGEIEVFNETLEYSLSVQRLHADAIQQLVDFTDGRFLTVSRDKSLRLWQLADYASLEWSMPRHHDHFINCVAFEGENIWTACSDGYLKSIRPGCSSATFAERIHVDAIRFLDFSPSKDRFICVSDDGTYTVIDSRTNELLTKNGTVREYIRSAGTQCSAGVVTFFAGTTSGTLICANSNSSTVSRMTLSASSIRAIASLSNGMTIVGNETGEFFITQGATEALHVYSGLDFGLTSCFSSDGFEEIICGYRNGEVSLFKFSPDGDVKLDPILEITRKVHGSIVGDITKSPEGFLLTCSDDHDIIWSTPSTLEKVRSTTPDNTAVNNLVTVGQSIICTTDGCRAHVINNSTGEVQLSYSQHRHPVRALTILWGSIVASGDKGGEVHLWDVGSGVQLHTEIFRDRIIHLGFEEINSTLQVVTESEITNISIDREFIEAEQEKRSVESNVLKRPNIEIDSIHDTYIEYSSEEELFSKIELSKIGSAFTLSAGEQLLLRRFALTRGGVRCVVSALGGGLSQAIVLHVRIFDNYGALRTNAVAKIGDRKEILKEVRNYDVEISRLPPRATPRKLEQDKVESEGSELWAVYYSLASEYERPLFSVSSIGAAVVSRSIVNLSGLMKSWSEGVPETRLTIAEIRKSLLSDADKDVVAKKFDLDWLPSFESEIIQARICTTHGDLHGENILIDGRGGTVLIDYGDVGNRPASIDPVTLELSHFFHPSLPLKNIEWPSSEQARQWGTESYRNGCPISTLVNACNDWSLTVGAGQREVAASAYSYLLRQLKYDDTNKCRALDLLAGTQALFYST